MAAPFRTGAPVLENIPYPSPTPSTPSTSLPQTPTARKPYAFATNVATVENPSQKDQYGSSSVPIYQTATFKGMGGQYDYTRSGNPTRSHLEHHLAKIYSAQHAFTVSSGMAALDVITRLLRPGDEVIAGDDLYGGTNRLLSYLKIHGGVVVHHVDTTDPSSVLPKVNAKTAMVLLESPTNPLLKIADLEQIALDVHRAAPGALVVVDNTMMSPYLQRPLELGADIVYDSGTKYLSGHHDLMAGVVTCNRDDIAKKIAFTINAVGNALSPFDSFLLLRGVKTLAVRMDRQQATAQIVAQYLHKLGFKVHYPGLPTHPRKDIHDRLASGAGAVLSFVTGDKELSERIVGATRLWGISVSFGAVNSLISMPCAMSHASIDPATRAARGLPEDLIRLCVGIEDATDLVEDLENAFLEAGVVLPNIQSSAGELSSPVDVVPSAPVVVIDSLRRGGVQSVSQEFLVSAPGKVILFGEHAVVHGVTAIASSVDLRCYGLSTPRSDDKVSLYLPDLNNWEHTWTIDELPWSSVTPVQVGEDHPPLLDPRLMEAIASHALPESLDKPEYNRAKAAAIAFLYLYMSLQHENFKPSFSFTARSALPIGAGLGSSASYSCCISTAILLAYGRIATPTLESGTLHSSAVQTHIHHSGRKAISVQTAEEINRWAFVAEKVLHGTPSGVDNSVATHGGALAFTRGVNGKKGKMENINGFKSVKFLLTDSKVPRNTKQLVAGVAERLKADPEKIGQVLNAIQAIADEASRALSDPEIPRGKILSGLANLMEENHQHLVTLGVSHPSLEHIREITAAEPFKLTTKLTGAGGGGCAVTLIPDDFQDSSLNDMMEKLTQAGFVPYLTSVGGSGIGISQQAQETAPTVREEFKTTTASELSSWADEKGGWLYV